MVNKILEIAFSGFWQFIGMSILLNGLAYFLVNGILRLVTRFFRLLNLLKNGYPPNHLDADGDFK
jgi:hypothetical protein